MGKGLCDPEKSRDAIDQCGHQGIKGGGIANTYNISAVFNESLDGIFPS